MNLIKIFVLWKKEKLSPCAPVERIACLELTRFLNWICHVVLPQAAFAASHLHLSISRRIVVHMFTADKVIVEIKTLNISASMLRPKFFDDPFYLAFSDASKSFLSYDYTVYVSELLLPVKVVNSFQFSDGHSSMKSRTIFFSIGVEIHVTFTSTDKGSLMAERLQVFYDSNIPPPFCGWRGGKEWDSSECRTELPSSARVKRINPAI